MAKQRKDGPEGAVRKDASGRDMFPWEVDPADQIGRRSSIQGAEEASGESDQPPGTGDSAA